MAVTIRNIIVGAGRLFINNDPTAAVPAFVAGTPFYDTMTGAGAAGWRDVGGTQDGIEIAYEPDFGEVEVDQLKDAALIFNQGLTVSVNTTLAEATLENLLIAWGLPGDQLDADASTQTLNLGDPGEDPVERQLVVVGRGPKVVDGANTVRRERVYHARRAISVDASSHSLRRTEAVVFPVSFRLLADPDNPGSEYGSIVDRTVGTAGP